MTRAASDVVQQGGRKWLLPLFILLSGLFCFVEGVRAADTTDAISIPDMKDAIEIYEKQGPAANVFCGVICLTAYAKLVGVDVQLEDLVSDPAFVRPEFGSSLAQLEDGAAKLGLYAQPVGNITEDFLRSTPHKVIVHVRREADEPFNHYELFLGVRGGKARLFDAPRPVYESDFESLQSRMSGRGLIVSNEPITVPGSKSALRRVAMILGFASLGGAALVFVGTRAAKIAKGQL